MNSNKYGVISETKFVAYSVLTIGLYSYIWFYSRMRFLRQNSGREIVKNSPLLLSIFIRFNVGSLYNKLIEFAEYEKIDLKLGTETKNEFISGRWIGSTYFVFMVFISFQGDTWLMFILALIIPPIIMLPLVRINNKVITSKDKEYKANTGIGYIIGAIIVVIVPILTLFY